jgi:ABC-type proline/glycine betaine transport system permease subunit
MPVKVLKGRIEKEQDWQFGFGLLLIWAMGWDESIQTTTLVIVSTLIALILVFRWELLLLEVQQLM